MTERQKSKRRQKDKNKTKVMLCNGLLPIPHHIP